MRLEQLRGTAIFDHTNVQTAIDSVRESLVDLERAAQQSGGEVAWSTMSIEFDVRTIEERRLIDAHPTIRPGLSKVTATATTIIP